jgi:hypothetical protein
MPIIQTREICKQVKVEQTTPRVVFQSLQTGPSGARHFGHTSCIASGFYWQLPPPCMSSRHRSPNTVLRDVAAKRRHVERSPTFSNASFRSHVRYITHVLIAAFTRSCSTLRPQAYQNTRSYIYLHTDCAFFISPSKGMSVGNNESMHWEAAQRYSAMLPDFQSLNMDHSPYQSLYYTRL